MANDLKSKLSQIPGLRDAQLSRDDLRPEYNVVFDRDRLAYYGMNSAPRPRRRCATGSTVWMASKYREDGDEYDIVVRYGEPFRDEYSRMWRTSRSTGPHGQPREVEGGGDGGRGVRRADRSSARTASV